jgi:hypothetical protein
MSRTRRAHVRHALCRYYESGRASRLSPSTTEALGRQAAICNSRSQSGSVPGAEHSYQTPRRDGNIRCVSVASDLRQRVVQLRRRLDVRHARRSAASRMHTFAEARQDAGVNQRYVPGKGFVDELSLPPTDRESADKFRAAVQSSLTSETAHVHTIALEIARNIREELHDIQQTLRLELVFAVGTEHQDSVLALASRLQSAEEETEKLRVLLAA